MIGKKELMGFVIEALDVTKKDAELIVETVITGIVDGIEKHGGTNIVGLGKFYVSNRKARVGRNPRTGESINIPEKTCLKFKYSNVMKGRIK